MPRRSAIPTSYGALAWALAAGLAATGSGCDGSRVGGSDGRPDTNAGPIASVTVSPSPIELAVSETRQLAATGRDAAGRVVPGRTASWSSANAEIASVSGSGLATAVTPGTTTITATLDGTSGSVAVTVVPAPAHRVMVAPQTASINAGATQPFTATVYDADGNVLTGRAVSWTSSNESVATVNAIGFASGIATGTATISATVEGITGSSTLVVSAAASCELVGGTHVVHPTPLPKPGYLQSVTDPEFGTTITRISGDPGRPIPVVGGTWGSTVYGNYPKDAVWNADQSLLLLKHAANARGSYLFLDGSDYRVLFGRSGSRGVDERWHPTLPDIMIAVSEDASVSHWNVRTNTSTWKFRPTGYSAASFGNYEGNPSLDGRYIVVQATRDSDGHVVAFALDVDAGTKYPDIDLTAAGASLVDWASISPLGNYVVVVGVIDGRPRRTKVFTKDGAQVAYWTDYQLGHYDLGTDAAGNELAFGGVGGSPNGRQFIARRLADATVTVLTVPTTFDWHASTRNVARPNWGYAVTNDDGSSPYGGEIYAVKLDGSGVSGGGIQRFAHHRSHVTDYEALPMPVPSPDGRRILFNSSWGATSGRPMQAYVIDTRPLCANGLPQ